VIKWINQLNYVIGTPDPRMAGFGHNRGTVESAFIFTDYIEKASGGRLIIESVPPGAIVPVGEVFGAVSRGTIQASLHGFAAAWAATLPEGMFEIGPTMAWEHQWEYWDYMENWRGHEILNEAYAEHNIWRTSTSQGNYYSYLTNFDPSTPEAFKGKKLRSWGMNAQYLTAIGGSPVAVPGPETYMAVKLGTVDGALYNASHGEVMKLNEVTDYFLTSPIDGPTGITLMFNQDAIDSLPEDLRVMVQESYPHCLHTWGIYSRASEEISLRRNVVRGDWIPVQWSEEDAKWARGVAQGLWDEFATQSPRCKLLVDQLKAQLTDLGKL